MDLQGRRRCLDCGETWSYFESGGVDCPSCGSPRSRGVGPGERPGPEPPEVEVSGDIRETLGRAEEAARSYLADAEMLVGDELEPPPTRYAMASEAVHLASELAPLTRDVAPEERAYAVDLVRGLPDGSPPTTPRPASLDGAHNLGVAETVEEYARAFSRWCRERGVSPDSGVLKDVEEARDLARRTVASDGELDDAVEGLRKLRDAHDSFERVRGGE